MNSKSFPMPAIDLSGKLIIKAQLGNDIRKIPIHNEEITYDELLLMMQRLFRGKIKGSDEITIKYKDEDGDMITIFDSSDLMFAKSLDRYLKLTLFVNGKPEALQHDQIKEIKTELLDMREKINHLITRLDKFADDRSFNDQFNPSQNKQQEKTEQPEVTKPPAPARQSTVETKANAALFDPLNAKIEADSTTVPPSDPNDPFDGINSRANASQSYTPVASAPSSYTPSQQQSTQQSGYPDQTNYQQQQQQQPQQQQQATYQSPATSNTQYPSSTPSDQQAYYAQQQQPQSAPQTQQQYVQQPLPQQQQQQQGYPTSSQQSAYPNSQSYAVQGQQASTYNAGYQQVDQAGYAPASQQQQQTSNPYRTMSPNTTARYPQANQQYPAYAGQPVPANAAGLPYAGTGYQ